MTEPLPARSLTDLVSAGVLSAATPELHAVASQYSVSITPAMLALIDPADTHDPIAAQFVPSIHELSVHPEERIDPIGDDRYTPVEGIVHRYPDRVLLKLLLTCPVYCRFCFRREQVGQSGGMLTTEALDRALNYIRMHPEIWEVILTGGDPLMLSNRRLAEAIARLNEIDHVKVLRIHTRVPVVEPARITPELTEALRGRAPVYVLLHCNHARELTANARAACARLVDAGIPMLSQSVLLRGVNDTAESLESLMRALVESRVKPHYLHHCDLAHGTSHFRVPIADGQALLAAVRGNVSGLCQPTYMLDLPGGSGKVPIGPVFALKSDEGWTVEDFRGHLHIYPDFGSDDAASI
ncbi:MAG: lysine-2,3-aminomutase-like protein [Rhizomicrobium sp.]|jgi:lysine 2,3-aminomutase